MNNRNAMQCALGSSMFVKIQTNNITHETKNREERKCSFQSDYVCFRKNISISKPLHCPYQCATTCQTTLCLSPRQSCSQSVDKQPQIRPVSRVSLEVEACQQQGVLCSWDKSCCGRQYWWRLCSHQGISHRRVRGHCYC